MSKVSSQLSKLYEDYYKPSAFEDGKRALAARDSVDSIVALGGTRLGRTIDVGAGDGAVSAEIAARGLATELHAFEISQSGVAQIEARNVPSLVAVEKFDGYNIPLEAKSFDTAVCAHVIEHVEHERLFLREIARVARVLYLIAPLEGGMRGHVDRSGGHINYYTPMTLLNLLETSGFSVSRTDIYASSCAYERHLSGTFIGSIKNTVRKFVRVFLGKYAPHFMVYVMCIAAESEE